MQLCLIYFQSCVIKSGGTTWMDGTAVHYVLFNREFDQFQLAGWWPIRWWSMR